MADEMERPSARVQEKLYDTTSRCMILQCLSERCLNQHTYSICPD